MTQLQQIRAFPHPGGNRIDLSWVNTEPVEYPLVRVMRRQGTYPTGPDDGDLVGDLTNETQVADTNLKAETVYYYMLFPGSGSPPTYATNYENRAAAMATGPYGLAGRMYELLPAIYHRYDTVTSPADGEQGQLRRFLELPGSQLDQLYSDARSLLHLLDLEGVDGRLLPLLAQWIGWETDRRLEYDSQRNEIRNAPALYQRIGIIPTVESTVKRILGWESRTKEFVHNVFLSNQPERLNLWATERFGTGSWVEPTAPLSLDHNFEGRPSATRDPGGKLRLFYHTQRNGHWDIWSKTLTRFTLDPARQADLERGYVSNLLQADFAAAGFTLAETATIVTVRENNWQIEDLDEGLSYTVKGELGQLATYHWSPSLPLTKRTDVLDKHPSACTQGNRLWLFWEGFDPERGKSQLHYRSKTDTAAWSEIQSLTFGAGGTDASADRREPTAAADHLGQLWLFWLERQGRGWQLQYNRHNGSIWVSSTSLTFPPDQLGRDPRVEADPFVLFQPAQGSEPPRLWLFWARRTLITPLGQQPRQTRWEIAYRAATGLDPNAFTWIHSWSSTPPNYLEHRTVDVTAIPPDTRYRTWYVNKPLDWGPVQTLPRPASDWDDREPAALLNSNGEVELFWSSNRDRSWSIWHSKLEDPGSNSWSTPVQVRSNLYSQRAPLPYASPTAGTQLLFRSNESVPYRSSVYRATRTVDFRYAGATTADSRNVAKNKLGGQFRDFQTYTFDTRRGEENWYARDTIGIYLTPTTEDPNAIARNRRLIQQVLQQFLPIQVRAVLIIEPPPYREAIYTYELPTATPQRLLGENAFDSLLPENLGPVSDRYSDRVPEWIWVYSWSPSHADHQTVDFGPSPADTRYRTWHIGLM